MKKLFKRLTQLNFFITALFLVLYAAIRFVVVFFRTYPKGDEASFLAMFRVFIDKGFYETNVLGNSTLFNMVSYVFYKMSFNELTSLRLTSLFFGVFALIILWIFYDKYFKIPHNYKLVAFLTAVNTMVIMSWIFTGINDVILAFFIIIFIQTVYKIKAKEKEQNYLYVVIGLVLALMLTTRMMGILFFPSVFVVLLSLFYLKKDTLKKSIKKIGIITFTFVITLLSFNAPSLLENGHLSFHEKKIGSEDVNWSQLQYLSAIGEEEGTLPHGKHFSIDEVKQYLEENGAKSLPTTLTESLFFDLKRTFKEFFNDLIYEIKPFTRLLGLVFVFNLMLFLGYIVKRKFVLKNILNQHIIIFSLINVLIISFIVITYVETRWFSGILLLLPIVFVDRIYKFKIENKLGDKFDFIMINLQLLSLTIMSLPYLIKNIGILF